jgi:hypothetical protein
LKLIYLVKFLVSTLIKAEGMHDFASNQNIQLIVGNIWSPIQN